MERVTLDHLETGPFGDGVDRHDLTAALGTTDVAVNHYRIAPGEGLPAGLHAHLDQEEIFFVLEGTATFETLVRDVTGDATGEEVVVGAGEAVRFAPGDYQSGRNSGEGDLAVLALGAPRDSEDVRLPVECPACGRHDLRLDTGGEETTFGCPECGDEFVPAPCPDCGSADLAITLADGGEAETEVVCEGCGTTYEDPPLEE